MIKVGVIGVGAMGRNHARVYSQMDDVDLVALADADSATAATVGRKLRVPAYTSYQEMLAREELQAVSVAVPTKAHKEVVLECLARGIHVLVEKPISSTLDEGREMIAHAEANGAILAVGHVERFNPAVIELQRRLREGALGRIFQIHARRLGPFPARIRDVGVVIDLATHDLDVMRFVTGAEVVRVYAETEQRIHTNHEDLLNGLLRFDNGVIGVLDINWLTPTKIRELSVTGERGMFLVNYLTQDLYLFQNDYAELEWDGLSRLSGVSEGNMVRIRIEKKEPLQAELEHFLNCVRNGCQPAVSGVDGLKALEIAYRLVESGIENRLVFREQ